MKRKSFALLIGGMAAAGFLTAAPGSAEPCGSVPNVPNAECQVGPGPAQDGNGETAGRCAPSDMVCRLNDVM